MRNWAELLVARERIEGVDLTGDGGLLTGLAREVLQCGLEVEMASGKKQSHVVISFGHLEWGLLESRRR